MSNLSLRDRITVGDIITVASHLPPQSDEAEDEGAG